MIAALDHVFNIHYQYECGKSTHGMRQFYALMPYFYGSHAAIERITCGSSARTVPQVDAQL
jgi:hypothetical protein